MSTSDSSSEGEDEEEEDESTMESTSSRRRESSASCFICLVAGSPSAEEVDVLLDESSAIRLAMVKERLGLVVTGPSVSFVDEGEGS